ncbi:MULTISPECIES: hypothetical protein [unclassified Nocardioides]|jgi:hypothetical protein|uniref:hypothetical protein n=1 Tax=unclassified Nocardioides TaxID=2615069 RepID=UPI0007038A43|nr:MULTISPECIES: hypothetical protein [unclassified Nocardioides]KRC52901.1 hypothetical protein ASE19_10870 [Nocardioides sp. Root79]KRC72431.1 hypothetical protein ASE20_07405 [Nocardioides sp. Root240]
MTDRGSFYVKSQTLRAAATMWSTAASDMASAHTEILPGVGHGNDFGVLAGSSGVATSYDNWSNDMLAAVDKAKGNFTYLDAALTSTANDYDGVDSTVKTEFAVLDRMIEP